MQIAAEEASGGVRTSDPLSTSRLLLRMFDIGADCIDDEVQNSYFEAPLYGVQDAVPIMN